MKPGPQGKLMYYYFYHGSDSRENIQFFHENKCIKFECNKFVLDPSLSPYRQTDRQTDRQRVKLILVGLTTLTGSSR